MIAIKKSSQIIGAEGIMRSRSRVLDFNIPAVILLTVILLLLVSGHAAEASSGQTEWEHTVLSERPRVLDPPVEYLSRPPVIDGYLDEGLTHLEPRGFNDYWRRGVEGEVPEAAYRLGYGVRFLYIYIEIESDEMIFNDRAYQNGDGFTLVLTAPRPDNAPSEEFYVLACSAVDDPRMDWSRKIFWYYNVDNIFLPVSDETMVEFVKGGGTVQFELLLDWADVYPYHPWLSEGIGFNLGFTKAIGDDGIVFYRVVDASIGAENSPREYALLNFEKPVHEGTAVTYTLSDRGNIMAGDTLDARTVTAASEPFEEKLICRMKTGEGMTVAFERVFYDCAPGLTYHRFNMKTQAVPSGGYRMEWESRVNESEGGNGISILPDVDPEMLHRRIEKMSDVLSPGSRMTFEFLEQEIRENLETVYPYESAGLQRLQYAKLLDYLSKAGQGRDTFAEERGFVRMAYRSKLDNTLQPYVVFLPEDYDPARKYPLLVFLHGSASTERTLIGAKGIPDGFIALGPKGRGPSNWYSWDDAQTDIAEAVESVKSNFIIDEKNVILTGFSMGGYGVYRTYYEAPETYSAIAVFSGMPRVGFVAPEGVELIDFNEEKYLGPFENLPVFIFHGKRDRNVPYEETAQFIGKLENAGANVEFHAEEDKGHESPNEETYEAFYKWIQKIIKK